jgi:hypothetical protein
MLKLESFVRFDKSKSMLHAYHQMKKEGAEYAVLSHQDLVDIGFVRLKDVTKYLANKYIPD